MRTSPDGGGVHSAVRLQSRALASLGAFLLLAGFTVTASLSGYFGVIYLGVPQQYAAVATMAVLRFAMEEAVLRKAVLCCVLHQESGLPAHGSAGHQHRGRHPA